MRCERPFLLELIVKGEEKLVVFGSGRERLYTRERAKALARKITCELLTLIIRVTVKTSSIQRSGRSAFCSATIPLLDGEAGLMRWDRMNNTSTFL
jgi:hypothetical protein